MEIKLFKKKDHVSDTERLNTIIKEAAGLIVENAIKDAYGGNKVSEKAANEQPPAYVAASKKISSTPAKQKEEIKKPVTLHQQKEELPVLDGKVKEAKKHFGLKWADRNKLKMYPDHSYIISMDFSNGTTRTFVVATKAETFQYRGRTYYLRYEDCKFDLSSNQYKLCYHEDYCLPYSREVHQKPAMGDDLWGKILHMINPDNFKNLLKFEFIKILTDSTISKYIKLCLLIGLLNFLLGVVSIIGIIKMGAFKGG